MAKLAKAAAVLLLVSGGGLLIYQGSKEYFSSIAAQQRAAADWRKNPQATHPPSQAGRSESAPSMPSYMAEGTPFSRLEVPRLHKALYVVEGDDSSALDKGPGHVRGSAMPGQDGNCVIAGHRDLHFRFLKDIARGDEVAIDDVQGHFIYKVTGTKIISPTDVEVLKPTSDSELHLITCYPFYFIGHAPKRFVVTAQLERPSGVQPQFTSYPVPGISTSKGTRHPAYRASARRPMHQRTVGPSEYEKSLEATRALNRAAAESL